MRGGYEHALRAAAPGRPQPSAQRLGNTAGHLSASDTTARATAMAAGSVGRLGGDNGDNLLSRVRAHDAGVPARCGLLGRHCELGRIGKVAARAAAITAEITARLADLAYALPGTVADRLTCCGHPGCRCHADPPQLHGPYHQWTRKKNGRTSTRILTDDQLADYSPWRQPPAAPRAHHRTRSPQPRHRRGRPPMEPLSTLLKCGLGTLNLWAAPQPGHVYPGQPQT